jgi:hypothetical protein
MKKLWVGPMLLLCSVCLHAQKTRMGQELPYAKKGVDYPLTVHVYGVHVRVECGEGYCVNVLFADVTFNGRKLELESSSGIPEKPFKGPGVLSFGDFRARLLENASGTELGDGYELLLPDRKVLGCSVTGIFE